MGFGASIPVSGQTYTRKIDAQILAAVSGLASTAAKFSSDIRMLQAFGEVEEPFESEQVGSSAMAYKRNPMRSERIAALARFVIGLESNAHYTHSFQFFERTLDDSANRRLCIPESFLGTDAILLLMDNVARGLEVHPEVIARRVNEQIPFMSTEAIMMKAVRRGMDRQKVHESIRRHSVVAAKDARQNGAGELFQKLAGDSEIGMTLAELQEFGEASRFVGRAPQQVAEILRDVVQPLLGVAPSAPAESQELIV
jgi:adenylosuccinate lyase